MRERSKSVIRIESNKNVDGLLLLRVRERKRVSGIFVWMNERETESATTTLIIIHFHLLINIFGPFLLYTWTQSECNLFFKIWPIINWLSFE